MTRSEEKLLMEEKWTFIVVACITMALIISELYAWPSIPVSKSLLILFLIWNSVVFLFSLVMLSYMWKIELRRSARKNRRATRDPKNL